MLKQLKKISPGFIKDLAREVRLFLFKLSDSRKPFLNKMKYLGFTLYFTKGAGLVQRIRFGNTHRIYEPELVEKICNEIKTVSEPIIIDIGSNIGLISLTLLRRRSDLKIFAFEPSPAAYQSFFVTIFANRIGDSIQLLNNAVADRDGELDFFVHDHTDSSGDGLADTGRAPSGNARKITMKGLRLDSWWTKNSRPKINAIKIDIEGAELFALKGAVETIKSCKPAIFLEISKANLKVYPHTENDILAFFTNCNYLLMTLEGVTATQKNIATLTEATDSFMAKPIL